MATTAPKPKTRKENPTPPDQKSEFVIDGPQMAHQVPYNHVAFPIEDGAPNARGDRVILMTAPLTDDPDDLTGTEFQGYWNPTWKDFELDLNAIASTDETGMPSNIVFTLREAVAQLVAHRLANAQSFADFQRFVLRIPVDNATGKFMTVQMATEEECDEHWPDDEDEADMEPVAILDDSSEEVTHYIYNDICVQKMFRNIGFMYQFPLNKAAGFNGIDADTGLPIPLGQTTPVSYDPPQDELDACGSDEERSDTHTKYAKKAAEFAPQMVFRMHVTADTSEDTTSGFAPSTFMQKVLFCVPACHTAKLRELAAKMPAKNNRLKVLEQINAVRDKNKLNLADLHKARKETLQDLHGEDVAGFKTAYANMAFGPAWVEVTKHNNTTGVAETKLTHIHKIKTSKQQLDMIPPPPKDTPIGAQVAEITKMMHGTRLDPKKPVLKPGFECIPTLELDALRAKADQADRRAVDITELRVKLRKLETTKIFYPPEGSHIVPRHNFVMHKPAGYSAWLHDQSPSGESIPFFGYSPSARVLVARDLQLGDHVPGLNLALTDESA